MDEFKALYEFIDLAQKNRKYPNNTAQGKRASLKLFETVIHPDELESLDLIEERMKEIFLSLVSRYKDNFSIQSLNTYKGRFLKTIQDYKRYGKDTEVFSQWEAKHRDYKSKDNTKDSQKDRLLSSPSLSTNSHVYKLQISLRDGLTCTIELPPKLTKEDASIITKIIGSLTD